ncbi:MAG: phosphatidylserine decarboxylase [Bacteroidales bacterium]|nr:phosphatidylserine decarboxylase [Bacteroidales bacterium]
MRIDKNSYGSLALIYVSSAAVCILMFLLVKTLWVDFLTLGVLLWFCIWQTHFFMVPNRSVTPGNNVVLSVADGRVIIIDTAFEEEYLKKECKRVSVYMNFFDLHANFWPASGIVSYYKYHPGKHLLAFYPKTAEENEHTCTGIRLSGGEEIFFKQIAGGFARRIVNYAEPGMAVKAGAQCGIIKFGSRIDIYLPMEAEIKVKEGDLLRSCESVIAEI